MGQARVRLWAATRPSLDQSYKWNSVCTGEGQRDCYRRQRPGDVCVQDLTSEYAMDAVGRSHQKLTKLRHQPGIEALTAFCRHYKPSSGPWRAAFHFGPRAATTTITCGAVLVDHVVLNDVHQTMFDPGKSDYASRSHGVVAQTACDVVANLLHGRHCGVGSGRCRCGSAVQGASRPPRSVKPLPVPRRKVSPSEAIREVAEDRRCGANLLANHRKPRLRTIQI